MFIWEEDSQGMGSPMCGTTRAIPLHPPAPKQRKHVEGISKTCYPKNTELSGFQANACVSGDMLSCKFSQRNVDWKLADTCKDLLQCKTHFKRQGKHCAAHTL